MADMLILCWHYRYALSQTAGHLRAACGVTFKAMIVLLFAADVELLHQLLPMLNARCCAWCQTIVRTQGYWRCQLTASACWIAVSLENMDDAEETSS